MAAMSAGVEVVSGIVSGTMRLMTLNRRGKYGAHGLSAKGHIYAAVGTGCNPAQVFGDARGAYIVKLVPYRCR